MLLTEDDGGLRLQNVYSNPSVTAWNQADMRDRGAGAGPAGTVAAGPMLEAKLMNLIKGRLQKL